CAIASLYERNARVVRGQRRASAASKTKTVTPHPSRHSSRFATSGARAGRESLLPQGERGFPARCRAGESVASPGMAKPLKFLYLSARETGRGTRCPKNHD